MQFSEIRTIIKDQLDGEGIYRTDTFLNKVINRGYKFIAGMSLYDVRRLNTTFDGTRNRVSIGERQAVQDGGFELSDPSTYWTAGNDAVVTRVSGAKFGSYCVSVLENGTNYPKISQTLTLQTGGSYVLSVHAKAGAAPGVGTNYYVFAYDNTTGKTLNSELTACTASWAEVTFNFTVPAGSSAVNLALENRALAAAGTSMMFDGAKVTRNDDIICPMFVSVTEASTSDARRIYPAAVEELEFYVSDWEGTKADQSIYYALVSPFHVDYEYMVIVPAPLTHDATPDHEMTVKSLCAVEPIDMSSDADEPTLPREFHDMLIKYTLFECYVGEPRRAGDALRYYKEFVGRVDQFVSHLKARFPGGRDFEPYPAEFISDLITRKRQESE